MRHHKLQKTVVSNAPFSHIVEAGDLVYLSGIIAADDLDAAPESFASIGTETTTCLRLIERMLATVSLSLANVTSVLVHVVDLDDFEEMNAAYGAFFEAGHEPVRTCVAVAALLEGARIEITCQARRP
ncbi:MAG: RidA family protein [Roseobacter sp.]|jgi:enamine deaminase RidA (YjgF/YER057c/UK114 family)|nr:RidA family protein [Roseobacter sp.]